MLEWIADAAAGFDTAIRPTVLETPLVERSVGGVTAWCKQENLQTTGSFKLRGAMAKLLTVPEPQRRVGVVTASTGNHGAAVAYAGRVVGAAVTVYVPRDAAPTKLAAIEAAGATIIAVPGDPLEAELAARARAESDRLSYVPPYNDRHVVAGQGTVGQELLRQSEGVDRVIVSVGGGGLISGVGAVIKAAWPQVELVAASPESSAAMHDSIEAGHIVDSPTLPTLSDGTAGGVEPGSITFDLCRRLIDAWVIVAETDIARAMVDYLDTYDDPIEGSAALALAAAAQLPTASTIAILCGGNVSDASVAEARLLREGGPGG